MNEICPNPGSTEEIIREEDLNIDWTDDKSVEGADNKRARVRSDDKGVAHLFKS